MMKWRRLMLRLSAQDEWPLSMNSPEKYPAPSGGAASGSAVPSRVLLMSTLGGAAPAGAAAPIAAETIAPSGSRVLLSVRDMAGRRRRPSRTAARRTAAAEREGRLPDTTPSRLKPLLVE